MIYLYVKQHSKTGLKYFGVTRKQDPFSYLGSGKYWKKHIRKHGAEFVHTIQLWEFSDQEHAIEFATTFSEENDIVKSTEWANLIVENGVGMTEDAIKIISEKLKNSKRSYKHSDEVCRKISTAKKGKKFSDSHKSNLSQSKLGKKRSSFSQDTKIKMSKAKRGKTLKTISCPHCGFEGSGNVMSRWHFDKCKIKMCCSPV